MTKEELRAKLIEANKNGRSRTEEEINETIEKFEKSLERKESYIKTAKLTNNRKVLNSLVKEFNAADVRLYTCNDMGIFVLRNGDKATVSFSFLNPIDAKQPNFEYDERLSKIHAIENYKLGKYTYEVDWKGRSEFAIYDAFLVNHSKFPGEYKNQFISLKIDFLTYRVCPGSVEGC
jgi:hypothetical protein